MRGSPCSPLFPYTTLFRSTLRLAACRGVGSVGEPVQPVPQRPPLVGERLRSEEHTSELQSLRQLVCRLLLAKTNQVSVHRLVTTRAHRADVSKASDLADLF